MKLDNVDLSKLQLADLPKFDSCPCELCDDGCFDRAGNAHAPQCRRRLPQRTKLPRSARCPLTHYQGTFLAATSVSGGPADHRRQPCPPPPDNEIPIAFKNAPMSAINSQKADYPAPPPDTKRQTPVMPAPETNNLLTSRLVPMETKTHYQAEYMEKSVVPVTVHPVKHSQMNITEPTATMTSQTTTRSHFKPWLSVPSHPYAEIPTVVGHVLYPGSNRRFDTTSASTFVSYRSVAPIKPAVRLEPSGNLQISGGTMDLRTNYRQDYNTPDTESIRSASTGQKSLKTEPKVYTRRPMNGISQTSFDFRSYPKHRPPVPAPLEPFQSQINLGHPYSPILTESQYHVDYPGYDPSQHPRQPAAIPKDEQRPYMPPTQKMDTMTVTQRDFQPIDLSTLPRIRLVPMKPSLSVRDETGPMESVTMSRYHYQAYEPAKSHRRYGELVPNLYIPPMEKFQSSTTSGDTFQGRTGPRANAFIPEMQSISLTGKHDHRTNYRMDYPSHGLSLCAAKAYAIANKKETTATPISAQ